MVIVVEQDAREPSERRQALQNFISRGLLSREESMMTGNYYSAKKVLHELESMLKKAETLRFVQS